MVTRRTRKTRKTPRTETSEEQVVDNNETSSRDPSWLNSYLFIFIMLVLTIAGVFIVYSLGWSGLERHPIPGSSSVALLVLVSVLLGLALGRRNQQ